MAINSTAGVTAPSIDVAGIVGSLIKLEQQPIATYNRQIASYQAKISALGSIQSALAGFQSAAQGLNSLTFNSYTAGSSNSSAVSASASSIAKPGSYTMTVGQLAQAQSLAAAGQASATTAIGNGAATTVTFDYGTISGGTFANGTYTGASFTSNGGTPKSITIDSGNNTLAGIRDAINAANLGVTASIISDGSASPYRLVLTSATPGAANSLKISVSGDASVSSLLSQDPAGAQNLSQTSTAQDASFTVNGITISKASNTVGDVIPGLTINLTGTSSSPITVNIAPNSASVSSAINAFVNAYNGVVKSIQQQGGYDAATKTAGTLQGDVSLSIIQSQMASVLTSNLDSSSFSNLSSIGIGLQKDGTLAVDAAKLNKAMGSDYQGVASLFVAAGKSSDSLVNYSSATSSTKTGNYSINVTQMATQGTAVGNVAAGLTVTTGVNDTLNLTVDGTSTSVVLAAGNYTAASLATQLQTLVNASTPISGSGKSVTVAADALGVLTMTSSSFGTASSIAINSGNGAANLFGTAIQTAGVDVAGTINGLSATGTGQLLISDTGDSQGLSLVVQGGAAGSRGTIAYTQGLARSFGTLASSLLGSHGPLASESSQFNTQIQDVQKRIDALNARISVDQAILTNQYAKLDAMLGSMNQLSSYLTQQLSRLP